MRAALPFSLIALLFPAPSLAQDAVPPLTAEAINTADLASIPAQYVPPAPATPAIPEAAPQSALPADAVNPNDPKSVPTVDDAPDAVTPEKLPPSPTIVRLQVLLDRQGASPGVIDGYDGDNVRKAVLAFETMRGLPADGLLDPAVLAALASSEPVIGSYAVTEADISAIVPPIPKDYAEQAQRDFLGYQSVEEELAERFHMDIDLFRALNPTEPQAGDQVIVAAYGPDRTGEVARIEADKTLRQVRAYDATGALLAAYPATIGSEDNPSPSGTHIVEAVAPMPTYTYNPKINFQQGDNTKVLTLPPGPNGPVGSMWIDLSEPTFGIHGTPEPSLIDKTGSHGCVRLTNWDANELAAMVKPGVPVVFLPS